MESIITIVHSEMGRKRIVRQIFKAVEAGAVSLRVGLYIYLLREEEQKWPLHLTLKLQQFNPQGNRIL